ncbi:hypothetical protein SBA3_4700005 [Candidatus Sulfopaludibacter sp. SbA3]|nr:hypothetical protein SBA3_4700005 [Candidatus Sulfopaludibacter sp. SbA3]
MASAIPRLEVGFAPVFPVSTRYESPRILRIDRYRLKPGTEVAVRNLQKQVALAMVRWGALHACLAAESLTGPKEVWRLSGFSSSAEQKRVAESLENNALLRIELNRIDLQIRVLTGSPATVMAHYVEGPSRGHTWLMGRGHHLVIAASSGPTRSQGTLFQTSTGVRYSVASVRTRKNAFELAEAAGPEANVFAIRPMWGMPAPEWTRHDPDFWNSSPMAKRAEMNTSLLRLR